MRARVSTFRWTAVASPQSFASCGRRPASAIQAPRCPPPLLPRRRLSAPLQKLLRARRRGGGAPSGWLSVDAGVNPDGHLRRGEAASATLCLAEAASALGGGPSLSAEARASRPWSPPMRSDAARTLSTRRPSTRLGVTDERLARSAGCEVQGDRAERGHAPKRYSTAPLLLSSAFGRAELSPPLAQETASPATCANGRGARGAWPRAAAQRTRA